MIFNFFFTNFKFSKKIRGKEIETTSIKVNFRLKSLFPFPPRILTIEETLKPLFKSKIYSKDLLLFRALLDTFTKKNITSFNRGREEG